MRKTFTKKHIAILLVALFSIHFSYAQEKDENFIFYLFDADAQIHEREMWQPDHNINFAEMQLLKSEGSSNWDFSNRPSGFLAMAKNERTGFQVFFRELEKERNLRVVVGPFTNSNGEELQHSTYFEDFFYLQGVFSGDSIAEPLIPYSESTTVKTAVGHNKAFYIELLSAKDQTAGYFIGNVAVYDGDELLQTKPVTVKVWNFALPEAHYSEVIMGLYNRNSGYGATKGILQYNNIPVDANGNVSDADRPAAMQLVRSYQEFLLQHGVSTYEIPRWLIDEDPKAAELTMADPRRKMFGIPIHRGDFYGITLSSWASNVLQQYKDIVYNNEFLRDKSYFYPFDEIPLNAESSTLLGNINTVLSELWPGYHAVSPFYTNYSQTLSFFDGKIDILCPNQGLFDPRGTSESEANIQDFKTREHTWRYPGDNLCGGFYSFVSPLPTVGVMRRVLFWQQYATNSDGILFWNCAWHVTDPWETKTFANTTNNNNGNGILIFPGYSIGQDPNTPIASLRLKQALCGINDYDYLRLSQEFLGEAATMTYVKSVLWYADSNEHLSYIINKEYGFAGYRSQPMRDTRYSIGEALSQANTEHEYGSWITAVVPDETHQGLEIRTCANCGTQESRAKSCCEFLGTVDSDWSNLSNWAGNRTALPTLGDAVLIKSNCVISNEATVSTLTVKSGYGLTISANGNLTAKNVKTETDAQITLEDGGELYCESSEAEILAKKNITQFTTNTNGWYTIAAPISELEIATNTNLTQESGNQVFDLYRLNETTSKWENYKDESNGFTTFDPGQGYLYAHNTENTEKQISGTLNDSEITRNITFTDSGMKGWNLIGNPFTHQIFKGAGGAIDDESLSSGYYVLENSGMWQAKTYTEPIKPLQGILVKNNDTNASHNLTIKNTTATATSESAQNAKDANNLITLQLSDGTVSDRAFIYLNEGLGLDKYENIDKTKPTVYIRHNDNDYAIAHIDKNLEELPIGVKSQGQSSLKISVETNASFEHLHLIDNLTGADIDLLASDSYSFGTQENEGYDLRFKLTFKPKEQVQEQSTGQFVYVSEERKLIFSNFKQGTHAQVIDINGQIVMEFELTESQKSASGLKSGIYVVRLTGDEGSRSQKIVIE